MSGTVAAALAKAALAILSDPQGRKILGYVLTAIFAPLILLAAFLCCLSGGMARHDQAMAEALFYGGSLTPGAPGEIMADFERLQRVFSEIDTLTAAVNTEAENSRLDPLRVKAAYLVLCPDDASLTAQAVTDCFYTRQVRTRTVEVVLADGSVAARQERYTVTVPLPPEEAYAALKGLLGRDITEEEKGRAEGVYALAAAQRQ